MLSDLSNRITKQLEAGKAMVISDLDISQNKLTREQFEALFMTLGVSEVKVTRYRMFGCATLDDQVLELIANHFRNNLTVDTAPAEMHLSDCAITAEGFQHLMAALEESDVFPKPNPAAPSQGYPLYLRLENNYIDEAAIQEKVDAGLIKPFTKQGTKTVTVPGGAKVNLVVLREGGGFQQKAGEPPAPDQAPAPKTVYDKHAEAQQMQQWMSSMGMKGWGWGKGGWQGAGASPGKGGTPRPAMALPSATPAAGKGVPVPAKGAAKGGLVRPATPAPAPQQQSWQQNQQQGWQKQQQGGNQNQQQSWNQNSQQSWNQNSQQSWNQNSQKSWNQNSQQSWNQSQQQSGWQGNQQNWKSSQSSWNQNQQQNNNNQGWKQNSWQQGSSGSAADRSRTPANRNTKPQAPVVPPKKGLPHPWEEHHSEEYGIPYYWNSETGEAIWERKPEWGK